MKRSILAVIGIGLGMTLCSTASAQVFGNPFYAAPTGSGAPSVFIFGQYGRGLNDESGESNFIGPGIAVALPVVTFWAEGGRISNGSSDETVAVGLAFSLIQAPLAPIQVMAQAGLGWIEDGGVTALNVPIGVAIKGNVSTPGAQVTPWIMPRINIQRVSGFGTSASETGVGVSAGVGFTLPGGFGMHTALDWLDIADVQPLLFGIGVHYKIQTPGVPGPM